MGEVKSLEERSLTGTWDINSLQRWKWKTTNSHRTGEKATFVFVFPFASLLTVFFLSDAKRREGAGKFVVTIAPKEIITFFVQFEARNL